MYYHIETCADFYHLFKKMQDKCPEGRNVTSDTEETYTFRVSRFLVLTMLQFYHFYKTQIPELVKMHCFVAYATFKHWFFVLITRCKTE